MSKNFHIIISGPPCTGKTTLGKRIAKEFSLPLISKDDIKESLFDSFGIKDREWSKKLGIASYGILYQIVESLLEAKQSFIIESNFKPENENERFLALKEKYDFDPLQIMCKTEGKILFERFKQRSQTRERHPGHVDDQNYEEFKEILLKGEYQALNVGSKVFDIDTTNFENIDYNSIFSAIKSVI